jgi:hypothetical protein
MKRLKGKEMIRDGAKQHGNRRQKAAIARYNMTRVHWVVAPYYKPPVHHLKVYFNK